MLIRGGAGMRKATSADIAKMDKEAARHDAAVSASGSEAPDRSGQRSQRSSSAAASSRAPRVQPSPSADRRSPSSASSTGHSIRAGISLIRDGPGTYKKATKEQEEKDRRGEVYKRSEGF